MVGEGRGKGTRVLMTFSLWNFISIVSVVNILPKDSTCHHGHTSSELLNGHRWYYTLCAHVDFLIPVRLRSFFCSAICQCQQMIYCSWMRHCVPHSRMSSALPLCQLTDALFVHLHPECQFSWSSWPPQSSRWDKGLSEGEWTLRCGLMWLWTYGKSPREWKKTPLSVACSSFQLIL